MFVFDIESLLKSLEELSNNNVQDEVTFAGIIEILKKRGGKLGNITIESEESLLINSRHELAKAEEIIRRRINMLHMENGVTIIDPNTTYIGCDVEIGRDTIIYPGNVIEGKTVIKENCVLYPNSRIADSKLGFGITVQSSVILESYIGDGTSVGPFAYIRPESLIGSHVRIGDFVEIKKSVIGDNTKVSHLTYIGDAEVGRDCNFGCGTVVVNYDGQKKHKTIIGNKARARVV
jgi:bifunctional UDP-N-acetylglucosamine pyrophosphorylase/glucosamine-1-phosphate N-acetyltransferase